MNKLAAPFLLRWRNTFYSALDLLYPRRCVSCGADCFSESGHLCWDCRQAVAWILPPCCSRCGLSVPGRVDHRFECHQCVERKPGFDAARSVARFEGPIREALHAFKYNAALWVEHDLVDMLESGMKTLYAGEPVDVLVPVPLHSKRLRERGYNQAELLTRALARRVGVEYAPRAIVRVRDTGSQTKLTARGRLSNVRHAFRVGRPRAISGKVILLVDDVMTTGATLGECARVLHRAGARRVLALTVARG